MTKLALGLDSSGKTASVCLWAGGHISYQKELAEGLTHSQTLLPLLNGALEETGYSVRELDCLAVTAGPGSFTGLRIGLALAKGLALPYATPAVPVSTLEAYAFVARQEGLRGLVAPVLDARRGEVYWALFDTCAGPARRLSPDAAGPLADLAPMLERRGAQPVYFIGDAAELCYNKYPFAQAAFLHVSKRRATTVAAGAVLAAAGRQPQPAEGLRPQYLRLSQAQRQRQLAKQAEEGYSCQ